MTIRKREQRLYDAAESAFTSEGGFLAPAAQDSQRPTLTQATLAVPRETELAAVEARRRVMDEASVTHDGRHYYDDHRYSGLVDAIDYSLLMRSPPLHEHQPGRFTMTPAAYVQTHADLQLMASLAISFMAEMYCFENYYYEHLEDAVGYARLH